MLESSSQYHDEYGLIPTMLECGLRHNVLTTLILLIGFFSFVYILIERKKYVQESLKNFFYNRDRKSIFAGSDQSISIMLMNAVYLFIASTSTILMAIYGRGGGDLCNMFLPLIFMVFPAVFMLFKLVSIKYLNYSFDLGSNDIFLRSYFSVVFGYGIVMYPIAVLMVYAPQSYFYVLLIISAAVTLVALLVIVYKMVQIFLVDVSSGFGILLYLCVFEILSIAIPYKMLIG